MKSTKEQKGITLIALVITIIVLIILAAVALGVLTGDNGIIKRAQLSALESEKADVIEHVKLKITEEQIDNGGTITKEQMSSILEEYGNPITENGEITGLQPENKDYIIPINNIYSGSYAISQDEKFYIFKDGNEYESVTGGWMYLQSPENNGNCQTYEHDKNGRLYLYDKGGNGKVREYWYWAGRNAFVTTNPVDISGYSSMHIIGHANSTSSYTISGTLNVGASTTRGLDSMGCYQSQANKTAELTTGTEIDDTIDLSGLDSNQTYYLFVWLGNVYYNTDIGFTVEKIWLE